MEFFRSGLRSEFSKPYIFSHMPRKMAALFATSCRGLHDNILLSGATSCTALAPIIIGAAFQQTANFSGKQPSFAQ